MLGPDHRPICKACNNGHILQHFSSKGVYMCPSCHVLTDKDGNILYDDLFERLAALLEDHVRKRCKDVPEGIGWELAEIVSDIE